MTVLDQATRDLITKEGLDETLFVEAGAGSGKTSALVSRIVNLVIDRGVRLRDIAAITFTEAAAAELQARIRVRFEQLRDDDSATTEARERARAAIEDADLAAISTLHGFASRILSEFAVAADLPPQVRVLDEVASQLEAEDRWRRFVDGLYEDPANEELLVRAALFGVPLEPAYNRQATLKDVAADFNQNWDRLEGVVEQGPDPHDPLPAIDFSAVDRAAAALEACLDDCTDPSDRFYEHLTVKVLPTLARLASIEDPVRRVAAMNEVTPPSKTGVWGFGRGSGGTKSNWGDDVESAKVLIDDLNEAMTELVKSAKSSVIDRLIGPIARNVLEAAEQRRADGGLEFHDLLVLARRMLRNKPEARAALHRRYTHLLLDEFQDTDPIQIELALRIAAAVTNDESTDGAISGDPDDPDVASTDWRDLDVEPGRLFFVGDPKQSIYRFRRADISLFLEARERFGPGGTHARLTTNFRTVEPILTWVNVLFNQLMGLGAGDRQPAYEQLVAHRQASSGADHRPILLGGRHPDPKVKAAELRELEAADVAAVLSDIEARPEAWPVDDGNGGWRPAQLADVAILVPTRTSLPFLRSALDEADISYRLATGTLVYATQEVTDLLAALRAVDDPTDSLSLVAALRSPLYACADTDLYTFHQAGGRWDHRSPVPEGLPADHPVPAAFEHLQSLWEQRWWSTPSTLLDRLIRERGAAMLGYGTSRPSDVWRRLRFLLDQARSFEESVGGDLRSFLGWAELQGAELARVHEPLLPETDDDAVRITTIHGAKGLEFPITVLSGMTTQLTSRRAGVGVVWSGDTPEVKVSSQAATLGFEAQATIESEMDEFEKYRLLYVGLTRARDHLIVSAHHKQNQRNNSFAGIVWDDVDRVDLWRRMEPAGEVDRAPVAPRAVPLPLDDRTAWSAARAGLLAANASPRVLSATGIATAALGAGSARLDVGDSVPDPVDPDDDRADQPDDGVVAVRRRGRAGSAIGSATHGVLQMIDLADPSDLDAHVRHQCAIEAIPEHEGVVALLARSAIASEAAAMAVGHRHHKELFVAAPVGDRVIEGYVDLLVDTPEGLVVVDWKTDSARSEAEIDAKLATYELQGAAYAVAVEVAVGRPVVDCRFVFCGTKGAIERSVGDLDGLKQRVRELVEG